MEFTKPLSDVKVKEGQPAVLSCEVNKPDLPAVWTRDGEKITPDNRKYTVTVENFSHTLQINDCVKEDDCEYTITIDEATSVGSVFVEGERLLSDTESNLLAEKVLNDMFVFIIF